MKNKSQIISAYILSLTFWAPGIIGASAQTPASAATGTTSSVASERGVPPSVRGPAQRGIPFHGVISSTDEKARTFTIAGKEKSRIFRMTDATILTKAGLPATMRDVTANEEVRGSYSKAADGSLEARIVKLGPKSESEKTTTRKRARKKAPKSEVISDVSSSGQLRE